MACVVGLSLQLVACGGASAEIDGGAIEGGAHDAATSDAASIDAATSDAGIESPDAAVADAATERDAGPSDAGPSDAGPSDAGPSDAGPSDAGPSDAGPSDAGPSDAGPRTFDVRVLADSFCSDLSFDPASISVPAGTSFTVRWINATGCTEIDIDMGGTVPIVIGLEPGASYHDTVRQWCGTYTGTYSFRAYYAPSFPYYLDVDCSG